MENNINQTTPKKITKDILALCKEIDATAVESEFQKWLGSMSVPRGKISRNDPCPCGSGKKYKKCCSR